MDHKLVAVFDGMFVLELDEWHKMPNPYQRSGLIALQHQARQPRKSLAMAVRYESLDAPHIVVVTN